jgi:2-dehydro-3-deoxygluconokinase
VNSNGKSNPRIFASIGECMIELSRSRTHSGLYERRYGGDTLNTAVYLARLLDGREWQVRYATKLGDDPFSTEMIAGWKAEGIDCGLVEIVKGRLPGLYMIDTDDSGERSFSYWRGEAPVRELFSGNNDFLAARLAQSDALYSSGITLAVLNDRGRTKLIELLAARKLAGALVAFDTNFRIRLWRDVPTMRKWFVDFIGAATICLPSIEDLSQIFTDSRSAADWITHLAGMGCAEIVLKTGSDSVAVWTEGRLASIALPWIGKPVDTTGAGDSFNAGYLAARVGGGSPRESVMAAHALASRVIQYPGAIIPRDRMSAAAPAK